MSFDELKAGFDDSLAKAIINRSNLQKAVVHRVRGEGASAEDVVRHDTFITDDTGDEMNPLTKQIMLIKSSEMPEQMQKEARLLAKFNDECMILSAIFQKPIQELRHFQRGMAKGSALRKAAMDTAEASNGLEWVPTGYSADLWAYVDVQAKVAALFPQTEMPTNPFKPPFVASQMTVYKVPETTDAFTPLISQTGIGTGNFTLTAVKIGGQAPLSGELTEDSIVPVIPTLRNEFGLAIGRGLDSAIINGDTAATHQDNDITDAGDVRKSFDGLRKYALARTTESFATFTNTALRNLRSVMGRYGVEPSDLAIIVGPKMYNKGILNLADIKTLDLFGQDAVVRTGKALKVDGIEVVVSTQCRENLNASGVHEATVQTKGVLLLVYKPGWTVGNRREMSIELFRDARYDQSSLIALTRKAFATPYTSTVNDFACVAGVDFTV